MNASYSELERLSAVETLRALANPERVSVHELVEFLESRQMWEQFAKITLADIREAFTPTREEVAKKRKRLAISEDIAGDAPTTKKRKVPTDGGLDTEEVARSVLPFVEGNGDVSFDDLVEYTRLDRRVLRHHLSKLVKEERLERIGTGRAAIYSTTG